jgi:hypothetical protein
VTRFIVHLYAHDSWPQVITAPPLISTIHKLPQHSLRFFQPAVSSPASPWQRLLTVEIFQLHALKSTVHRLPYRIQLGRSNWLPHNSSAPTEQKTPFIKVPLFFTSILWYGRVFFQSRYLETGLVFLPISTSSHSNGSTSYYIYIYVVYTSM